MSEHEADPVLSCFCYFDHDADARLDPTQFKTKLKGSIGEGPNHSNFSDQSSVRIQEILLEFVRNFQKIRDVQHFRQYLAKFR